MRASIAFALLLAACQSASEAPPLDSITAATRPQAVVKPTADFEVTGDGSNPAWAKGEWNTMNRRQPEGLAYECRFKVLYSATGLYVLQDGTDKKLTTTGRGDFEDLWFEDVYESFFWTDPGAPLYFEYEISPMGNELPILVPNTGGAFMGWRPWHYENDRKVRKATAVRGGPKEKGAAVQGWSAEYFIPYVLLKGLKNQPPKSGSVWRANFYRMDYDNPKVTQWDWARVGSSFHEYQKFGTLVFE